ncbi:MAG TPA: PPC domain-containing protein, partial [Pirellulaceae bacterium]
MNSATHAAKFTLRGPNSYVGFSDLTADSSLVTLPSSGDYRIEVRSANGSSTGAYAFQVNETSQTLLSLGTSHLGSIPGSGFAKLFRVDLTTSTPLRITVDGANNSDRLEVYAKAGSAPNRQMYDFRNSSSGADHTLAVPLGVPGSLYILVYADHVAAASSYSIRVDAAPLALSSVTPTSLGRGASSIITLSGLGLRPGTSVQLIPAAGGATITSSFVSIDSTSQVTAYFDLSQAAIGTYHVRATVPGGTTATLNNAFQVTQGSAQLETYPVLPGALGRHGVATLYVEYANVGTASMAAPILTLRSNDPDDSDRPFLTLDPNRLVEGFWTSALPDGFSTSVQFLASGASPGVLQPGERIRMPVYYAGLQQPWDMSDLQVEFVVTVHEAGDPRTIDWTALSSSLRPESIQPEAWSPIYANLQAQVGTTWGDYVRMISDNAAFLGRLGQRVTDVSQLFGFELLQASGFDPDGTLESRTDAAIPTPGLVLDFTRSFG